MNETQELRGELREQLSSTLVIAAAAQREMNQALENYELGKAAGLRLALALMSKAAI
jgi:hypothetical protein